MNQPKWEVADVLRLVHKKIDLHTKPYTVQKAVRDITQCRTSALGGHKSTCSNCGNVTISYNSCRNRHCPKCQYSKTEQWILDRKIDLIPVSYFHVVFTLPHVLNPIAKAYPFEVYNLLFHSAWKTISTLARDPKWLNAHTGMVALLHTWGQNLSFHPHLHCIMPQGGWDRYTKKWIFTAHRNFLFPIKVMSLLYKKYFINALKSARLKNEIVWQDEQWIDLLIQLKKSSFNVFAKKSFAAPDKVMDYLGRYSHKVAITNHRIVSISEGHVRFQYKDYRDGIQKLMTLTHLEFSRRFLQHILPKGFAKIRHYGILANRCKSIHINNILMFFERRQKSKTKFDPIAHLKSEYGIDISLCTSCNRGHLHINPMPHQHNSPFRMPIRSVSST